MKRVVVESPLKGNIPNFAQTTVGKFLKLDVCFEYFDRKRNKKYAKKCMRDCLLRGESPYASHLLFDQKGLLDDTIEEERNLGMQCGFNWNQLADKTVIYIDRGISNGMQLGILDAKKYNRKIEVRSLGKYNQNYLLWLQAVIEHPEEYKLLKEIKF